MQVQLAVGSNDFVSICFDPLDDSIIGLAQCIVRTDIAAFVAFVVVDGGGQTIDSVALQVTVQFTKEATNILITI